MVIKKLDVENDQMILKDPKLSIVKQSRSSLNLFGDHKLSIASYNANNLQLAKLSCKVIN